MPDRSMRGRAWRRSWWRDEPWGASPCLRPFSPKPMSAVGSAVRALFQDLERGKFLAFQNLEERAAAGGDVADVLVDAVLRDGRERVAAARDAEGVGRGDRAGDRLRAVRERGGRGRA